MEALYLAKVLYLAVAYSGFCYGCWNALSILSSMSGARAVYLIWRHRDTFSLSEKMYDEGRNMLYVSVTLPNQIALCWAMHPDGTLPAPGRFGEFINSGRKMGMSTPLVSYNKLYLPVYSSCALTNFISRRLVQYIMAERFVLLKMST